MDKVFCLETRMGPRMAPVASRQPSSTIGTQGFLIRLFDRIGLWQERAASRRALAQLDERLLRDIGLDVSAAADESAKPFWQA